jgi:hypothetical protein
MLDKSPPDKYTLMFSDFVKSRKYYKQLLTSLEKEKRQFMESISTYKRPNGAIYTKEGIYLGVYEQVYYSVPIALSKDGKNFFKEGFCD